jgi:hypothetical protein
MVSAICWRFKSIYKDLRKKKYKALFRYFYDPTYRTEVNYMLSLVRFEEMECIQSQIKIGDIVHGHSINYPLWIRKLRYQIRHKGYNSLEPLKVVWDSKKSKFLIVDGNHRLSALKAELGNLVVISVDTLIPKRLSRRNYEGL